MRPTRRGYGALAVVAVAFVFAWSGDPARARALNAVAAPVLVAVLAGAVAVHRAGTPTVERSEPNHGFPGETRTVELTVEGGGVAAVTDDVGDGLSGAATFDRTLPATVEYEVTYEERGVHALGPATVHVRDVLGLVAETYRVEETTRALVYPRVYPVGDPESFLRTLGPRSDERSEFDRLREYVPGDSLRDIHWKHSARHDELLVTEYTDPMDEEAVSIAAACTPDHDDEMATAAATLFAGAVGVGLTVDLAVPDGRLPQGYGETHRRHGLELLARTGPGEVSEEDWEAADVRIRADASDVEVAIDERVYALDDLTGADPEPLRSEVVA